MPGLEGAGPCSVLRASGPCHQKAAVERVGRVGMAWVLWLALRGPVPKPLTASGCPSPQLLNLLSVDPTRGKYGSASATASAVDYGPGVPPQEGLGRWTLARGGPARPWPSARSARCRTSPAWEGGPLGAGEPEPPRTTTEDDKRSTGEEYEATWVEAGLGAGADEDVRLRPEWAGRWAGGPPGGPTFSCSQKRAGADTLLVEWREPKEEGLGCPRGGAGLLLAPTGGVISCSGQFLPWEAGQRRSLPGASP